MNSTEKSKTFFLNKMSGKPRFTTAQFVQNAEAAHPGKYDYSLSNYRNAHTPVIVICPIHGQFTISPNNHCRGAGCKYCYTRNTAPMISKKKFLNSLEEFIKKAEEVHPSLYTYEKATYISSRQKTEITCPIHGSFFQTPMDHLKGRGCRHCAFKRIFPKMVSNTKEFVEKSNPIHSNRYDYSEVIFTTIESIVKIICPVHGPFFQTPHHHLAGYGCRKCCASKGEIKITSILQTYNIDFKPEKVFLDCLSYKNGFLRFDFFLPNQNILLEYDGKQHYTTVPLWDKTPEDFEERKIRDTIKDNYAREKSIKLVRIPYFITDIERYLINNGVLPASN